MRFRGLDSGDWVTIKDLKESYPVPLANYDVANDLQTEPAFIIDEYKKRMNGE